MRFKVGDKVKVREDLIIGRRYCMLDGESETFVPSMSWLKGKIVTICSVSRFGYGIEESGYCCTDEMFEAVPVEDESNTKANTASSVAEFKVGDRVRCLSSDENPHVTGKLGTVIDHHMSRNVPLVEFDVDVDGHSGRHTSKRERGGRDGYCWYCEVYELELIEPQPRSECAQKIVITSDGKESTATLYNGDKEIRSAKSVMPKDVDFEFMSYAKSALKHLIKECSRPNSAANTRYPNGTVVCIENNLDKSSFTIGKAYNVADGELNDNTGFCRELNWLNNDPTSGFCVYETEDGPLVKFVVFTGPAGIK